MRRVPTGALVALLVLAACESASDTPADTQADDAPVTASAEPTAPSESPGAAVRSPAASPRDEAPSATETRRRVLNARLIDAARDNDLERASRLIADGADVNAKDDREESAYLLATSEGHLRLLELTLEHGAEVRSLDSFRGTGLIRAAERGHADVVGRLLQTDIEVDHVNRLGWTALLEAVVLGDGGRAHQEVVRLLLDAGADRTIPDADGVTALEHARARGHREIARLLSR